MRDILRFQEPFQEKRGPAMVGAPLLSSVAGPSVVGALGAGSVFAPAAGSLFSSIGLGTVLSLGSSFLQGAQQSRQSNAEAQAYEYNARLAERNARIAESQTQQDLERQDRQKRLRAGSNVARGGASGVGQPLDILMDNAAQEELDILTIKQQGQLQKSSYLEDAQLNRMRAKSTKSSGKLTSTASILGGVSKAFM